MTIKNSTFQPSPQHPSLAKTSTITTMAIKFNHSTTPSSAPIPIPAPIPTSTTLAIPSLLSHITLANRISSFLLVLPGLTTTGFIMLMDVSLYAHHLCTDSPSPEELHNMTACLYDLHLAIPLDSYLNVNSLLWTLYANLQNQHLGNLLTLTITKQSITCHISMIWSIHHQIEENLAIAFTQLGMPELVTDIDCYLRELGEIPIPPRQPTSYPSPFPLSQDTEQALRRIKLMYEISTQGTLDSEFTFIPLQSNHPHYRKTCFKCHCLGYLWANCPYYECPHYLSFSPGYFQHHCPHHPTSPLSSFLSSLGNSPIIHHSTLHHSNRMISTNTSVPQGNWCTQVQDSHSHSPNRYSTVDSDYDDSPWGADRDTNISGSPSYRDF